MNSADWQNTPFTLPLLLSGLLCGWLAYVSWRRRAVPGAAPLAVLMAALGGWALINLVEKSLVNHELRRAVAAVLYPFIVTVPGAWLVFTARFASQDRWLPQRLVPLLLVEPVLILALVFTNFSHGLIYAATEMKTDGPYAVMIITHGPFFYVNAAYTWLLFAVGAVLLITGVTRRQHDWAVVRLAVMLGAMLVPVAGNVAWVLGIQARHLTDLTPVYFAVPGLAAAWLLFGVRVFDVLPIARDLVLDCLGDAVFVLDSRNRILDANPAARSLLPDPRRMWKQSMADALPDLGTYLPALPGAAGGATEIQLRSACPGRFWDLHALPLVDHGRTIGGLVRLTDVTERRRAAEARSLLAAIVESSGDAVIGQTLDGVIVSWNPGADRLYGYSAEEALGRPFSFLFLPGQADDLSGIMEKLRLGKTIEPCEVLHVRKDGRRVDVSLSLSPVRDAGGAVTGVSAICRDVTDRKQAEAELREAESRFRQLAENVPGVFWMADARVPRILFISPAYEDVWGRTCRSLYEVPGSYLEAIHPEDRERVRDAARRHRRGEYTNEEYRVLRPDGSTSWVWDRGFPIRDQAGQVYRVCGIAEDITARKQAEEALKEADRRKDEFLAVLAHELRNPLAPMTNALHILRRTDNPAACEQARAVLERQLLQMVRLIDDLLDVSRVTRGKLRLRMGRIELSAAVASAVETARPLIEASGHELAVTLPPDPVCLDGDLTRLAQVFANLLNNAAKYTERGGRIWLTAERQGSDVVVSVKDTGVGIAAEALPRLFDMFSQVDRSLERSQGGLGIGLSLVKGLIEMHGGSVEAQSDGPGRGSEFVVRLPVAVVGTEREGTPPPLGPRNADLVKRRILVVEDNQDSANTLAMLLRGLGNEVRTAFDGLEAVETAAAFGPDVILLDIGLPKLNGYDACRRIRQQPGAKGIVIIAVSGYGQEKDRRRSTEAGFDQHLVKPVALPALQQVLTELAAAKDRHVVGRAT
jgi:PAS domain S-box-containing protein